MSFSHFSQLINQLDTQTGKLGKIQAMVQYFGQADPADAAWAVFFLSGRRLKRLISSRVLKDVFLAQSQLPEWLYGECYAAIGDTAETISLLSYSLPAMDNAEAAPLPLGHMPLQQVMTEIIQPLAAKPDLPGILHRLWQALVPFDCFVFNKLISGAFRIGVSQGLLVQALSQVSQQDAGTLQHRLMGHWEPTGEFYSRLIHTDATSLPTLTHPYPFYLASPLETMEVLGEDPTAWQIEWKWDGIRGQLISRSGIRALWSRGEELISERFPELMQLDLPDGIVLDGEVLAWRDDQPLPFAQLQQRIGRKTVSPSLMAQIPVVFHAYDMLECKGVDIRALPLAERRQSLTHVLTPLLSSHLRISPVLPVHDWSEAANLRQQSRLHGVEGLMIKRLNSPYGVGRKRGDWWKWKLDPYTIDAVLTLAQVGHGRRADKFTDYTFAVFNDQQELVPIAKAYSGLTDEEIRVLDKWIRQHTLAKFGPVRQVKPVQVFELGFEHIALSNRHKSGIAVRFPRILRWRQDKPVEEIDTVKTLKDLITYPTP